jgi:hypothetical protein
MGDLAGFLARLERLRRRGRDDTARLFAIRPWGTVSEPIAATSADAAIFELLGQVGCRPA